MSSKYGDWTRGEDEALLNILGGVEVARGILRGMVKVVVQAISYITATYTIIVDETLSVEDAVKTGKFDWSNENITSDKFPQPANGKKSDKEVFIFHFNKQMTSKEVIAEMNKTGYKPANIWVLVGLAIKEPDLQRKFPIVALDSVGEFGGDLRVPCLCGGGSGRRLSLGSFDGGWGGGCRFVAVCK